MVVRSDANSAINQLRPTSSSVLSLRWSRVIACENDDNHSKISVKRPHIRPSVCSKYPSVCVMQESEHETSEVLQKCLSPSPTHFDCPTLLLRAHSGTLHSQEIVNLQEKIAENRSSEGDLSLNLGKCSKTLQNGSSSLEFNHYPVVLSTSIRPKHSVTGDGAITCE